MTSSPEEMVSCQSLMGSWRRVALPFGTRFSIGYTSEGCLASRFAGGKGLEAWISAWTAADLAAMSLAASAGMDWRRADSAAVAAPSGALESCAFSAMDWVAFRDFFVPNVYVRSVFCSRMVLCGDITISISPSYR